MKPSRRGQRPTRARSRLTRSVRRATPAATSENILKLLNGRATYWLTEVAQSGRYRFAAKTRQLLDHRQLVAYFGMTPQAMRPFPPPFSGLSE